MHSKAPKYHGHRRARWGAWALLSIGAASALADGEMVTVTTLHDVSDFGGAKQVGDLPGPDGNVSFREAVTATNNTIGGQLIEFSIPIDEFWLLDDVALLKVEQGAFFVTDNDTYLDFTSQTRNIGDTNPVGNEVGFYGLEANGWGISAMFISSDGCTVNGLGPVYLRGYGVEINGNNNRVIGSMCEGALYAAVYVVGDYFGTGEPAMGNIIGGTLPEESNTLSAGNAGVRIDAPAEDNIVIGNILSGAYNGIEVRGSIYTTTADNNRIGGPAIEERNVISGAGNFDEEGCPSGAMVYLDYANGTIVENNYIGTTPDGMAAEVQVGTVGIGVSNADNSLILNNLVGGIAVDGYNHCAGIRFGTGMNITADSDGTVVMGNMIGTDATGFSPIPNHRGVDLNLFPPNLVPSGTIIGGALEDEGNLIAFNELEGVRVGGNVSTAHLTGNSIHSNGTLGIDLLKTNGTGGVSTNDSGDADGGGNKQQNFPVMTLAEGDSSQITLGVTLNSTADATFTLEFFANSECDLSGYGEGERFLGALEVLTDGSGNATFEQSFVAAVAEGEAITSTATDPDGNTSEFSACLAATIVPTQSCAGDANGDGTVDPLDSGYVQARFGCSVGTGDPACDAADVNIDAVVDPLDVGFVLARLGNCE